MDVIRIEVRGDAKDLDPTIKKLEELGKVDKKNADQFKKHHEDQKKHSKESIDLNTKLGHSFKELGQNILAAFAVERIIEFGAECVEAFSKAQEAAKKLEFAVVQANGETSEAFERLKTQAEDLSRSLNNLYDNDAIMGVQAQLAQFGLSGRMIEGLTPTILDIAAATGKSLPEATEKAIAAINGQTKGLKDIGVAFKDTGSKTENYNKLLKETAKFSGAAQEKTTSLEGRISSIKNTWGDFMEDVGEFIARGFDVLDFLMQAPGATDEWSISISDLAKNLGITNEELERMLGNLPQIVIQGQIAAIKRAGGDGVALQKLNQQLLLANETSFKNEVLKLKDKEIEERIKKEADLQKRLEAGKLFEIQKEGELTHKARIEILEQELAARKKMEDDATLKGEEEAQRRRDKLLQDRAKFSATLLELEKEIRNIEDRALIEGIRDSFDKKMATIQATFQKERDAIIEQRKKLNDIISSETATKAQKDRAKKLLEETFNEEQILTASQYKRMEDLLREHEERLNSIVENNEDLRLKLRQQAANRVFEDAKQELLKRLKAGEITQKEYDERIKRFELAKQIDFDRQELENLEKQQKRKKDILDKQLQDKVITQEEYDNELLKLQVEYNDASLKLQKDLNEKTNLQLDKNQEKIKATLKNIFSFSEQILASLEKTIEGNVNAIDTQLDRQQKLVDTQRLRAQQGLANDLAFEERRQDELMKKKLEEQKKLKRVKELETFLNAMAKFAEENPNTALAKALGLLAATKTVEAVFAEDGALLGKGKTARGLGAFARRHKSGKDVLVHAEEGEAVLPTWKVAEMGLNSEEKFRNFLRTPFHEKVFVPTKAKQSNADLIAEIHDLKQVIKDRPVQNFDLDLLGNIIEERINAGLKQRITHQRKFI